MVEEQNGYSHRTEGIRRDKMMKEIKETDTEAKIFKIWQKGVPIGKKIKRKENVEEKIVKK